MLRTALLLVVPALLSATVNERPEIALHYPQVHQVRCEKARGSAFRISEEEMVSVAHVTMNKGCKIGGQAFTSAVPKGQDFAIIAAPTRKFGGLKVNCDGFKPGEWYYVAGYAHGYEWQTVVRLFATMNKDFGMRVLRGEPIKGMSGAPIMNTAGEAVGTLNAKHLFMPLAYSVELKDTPVCA